MHSMRSVIVKINDRGTLAPNRVIDLSSAAARELGILEEGLASVKLEVVRKTS
jgi:rare lipoprotein A